MNRKELNEIIAKKTGSTKVDAARAVSAVLDTISDAMRRGQKVTLVGFGTFEVRQRAARTGRNPATGASIKIKATKVPAFKAGAALKKAAQGKK